MKGTVEEPGCVYNNASCRSEALPLSKAFLMSLTSTWEPDTLKIPSCCKPVQEHMHHLLLQNVSRSPRPTTNQMWHRNAANESVEKADGKPITSLETFPHHGDWWSGCSSQPWEEWLHLSPKTTEKQHFWNDETPIKKTATRTHSLISVHASVHTFQRNGHQTGGRDLGCSTQLLLGDCTFSFVCSVVPKNTRMLEYEV